MSAGIAAIRRLCSEAGMPPDQIERVIIAVSFFYDDTLQLRAAQALADAWKQDHEARK